jgi:uncharacterized protein (TIGR02246 family)
MKRITKIILILTFTATAMLARQDGQTVDRTKDEAAIRANVEQMVKGWNMKSGAEFSRPFAEDADFVVINGRHIKGHPAIVEGHNRIFETIFKDSTLSCEVEQIRFLRPDVALVHMRSRLKVTSTQTVNARITMVMTKDNQKWKIAAFHNTQIQEPEPNGGK